MENSLRIKLLKVALVLFGLAFIFGLAPLIYVLKTGWQWTPNQYEYEQMILGIYAVLGIFLLLASRNPLKHLSLIWFTVWSSVVHGLIMAVQAIVDPTEMHHFLGDVPVLIAVAIVLALLTPRQTQLN